MQASSERIDPRAYYALAMLVLVYTLNFIDRQIVSILLPSIQEELLISDQQAGLLGGCVFCNLLLHPGHSNRHSG